MSVTALVPARRGSKGIPGKNWKRLCGKPLFQWSVDQARASRSVDRVVVSTNAPEIEELADCEVIGQPMASDTSVTSDVEDYAIAKLHLNEGDILVTLHPTSPLRLPEDIDGCVTKLQEADACRTVTDPDHHPYLMFLRTETGRLEPYTGHSYHERPPRQYWPELWVDTGAVWARRVVEEYGRRLVGYEVPRSRSVDIDNERDWKIAEFFLRKRENESRIMEAIGAT